MGVAYRPGTLTPPETKDSPIWDLYYIILVETHPFPNLSLFSGLSSSNIPRYFLDFAVYVLLNSLSKHVSCYISYRLVHIVIFFVIIIGPCIGNTELKFSHTAIFIQNVLFCLLCLLLYWVYDKFRHRSSTFVICSKDPKTKYLIWVNLICSLKSLRILIE